MKRSLLFLLIVSLVTGACHNKLHHPQTQTMNAIATFDNTRWKLLKLPGIDSLPLLEKDAFIQFNKGDTTFHGYAGCNNMTGRYTSEGSHLTIGPAAMTRMMCPEENMKVEDQLSRAINSTDNYLINGDHLELRKGNELLAEFKALYLK